VDSMYSNSCGNELIFPGSSAGLDDTAVPGTAAIIE
jgi:hypothetical protein